MLPLQLSHIIKLERLGDILCPVSWHRQVVRTRQLASAALAIVCDPSFQDGDVVRHIVPTLHDFRQRLRCLPDHFLLPMSAVLWMPAYDRRGRTNSVA